MTKSIEPIQQQNMVFNGAHEASSPETYALSFGIGRSRANGVNEIPRHKNGFLI